MSDDPSAGEPPVSDARKRRLRFAACGVLVFLLLEGVMLVMLPHDESRSRVFPLLLADLAFAAVVCMILVFSLRKR